MSNHMPRRSRARMTEVDPNRIGKLVRMLASDRPGEVVAAAAALKRTLAASGRDLHDLAATVESGLRQEPPTPRAWGPPRPSGDDWQSMCWYAHHHRHRLPAHHRELIEDLLLGRGFHDGRVTQWHRQQLRAIVASLAA
jgi:hypothetical protein